MENPTKTLFQGKKFTVIEYIDQFGKVQEKMIRIPSVAIIAITLDKKILINREKRKTLNDYIYNIPSGMVDKESDPVEAARRELREETNCDSDNFELFMREIPKASIDYNLYIYISRNVRKDNEVLEKDPGEEIETLELTLDEAYELAIENKIYVEFYAYALIRFCELVKRGKIEL